CLARRSVYLFPTRRSSDLTLDVSEKLAILADAAKYDASCASSGSKSTRAGSKLGSTEGMGICHSYTPDGRCISLLKLLLTNYCRSEEHTSELQSRENLVCR